MENKKARNHLRNSNTRNNEGELKKANKTKVVVAGQNIKKETLPNKKEKKRQKKKSEKMG